MPTASEYRRIAFRLEHALESLASLLRPIMVVSDASPPVSTGGQLEHTVNTALSVTRANVDEVGSELQRQITEANRRASVCERYATAVREYRRLDDPVKSFPRRPASWADHGQ